MATTYASPYSGMASQPFQLPTAEQGYRAKQYCMRALVTMAAQAAADVIKLGVYPNGVVPAGGEISVDTSTSTATVAIGNATTAGKYKAAGAVTTLNAPQPFGVVAGLGVTPLTADEEVIATIGTAALPGSGTMIVDLFYYGV